MDECDESGIENREINLVRKTFSNRSSYLHNSKATANSIAASQVFFVKMRVHLLRCRFVR